MTETQLKQRIQKLLNMAPVDLEDYTDKLSGSERAGLAQALEGLASKAAWVGAYLEERYGYGCGDQGHEDAVKKANKARHTVRCGAFGYNQTNDILV